MLANNFFVRTYKKLEESKRLPQMFILISFLLAFLVARIFANNHIFVIINVYNGLLHIHHFVFGIFFLIISGYFGISFAHIKKVQLLMSILFGIGAALTIDEFALWLYLKDVYWANEGRYSIDLIIIFSILFAIGYLISDAHKHRWLIVSLKKTLNNN